jgi:cell fate (sporulation/competence/biofilm development) regulator YlbF (YheA/YmcA/DUF963 family)
MDGITEKAKELGRLLGQTPEYQTLRRAAATADDDREIVELREKLQDLDQRVAAAIRTGEEPDGTLAEEHDQIVAQLQSNSIFQSLISAQMNFDKILARVNQTITEGIEEGAEGRIILPT